jgi:hypothetical protein
MNIITAGETEKLDFFPAGRLDMGFARTLALTLWSINVFWSLYYQDRTYSCGRHGAIKMSTPLLVTTNLGYDNYFSLLLSLIIPQNEINFRDFREANVRIKPLDSIYILWGFRGDRPGLKPGPVHRR